MCYRVSFDLDPDGYKTDEYCAQFGGGMEGDWCCVERYDEGLPYIFHFTEDSNHDLEFYCEDKLGNRGITDLEYFKVDTTSPTISKTLEGPSVGDYCPPRPGHPEDVCYIQDEGTIIHVNVVDGGDYCAVDEVECDWCYYLYGQGPINGDSGLTPPFDIVFHEDSKHELHIKCWDRLGNEYEDIETFYVDSTPPETVKRYQGPQYPEQGYPKWISSSTLIYLESTDPLVNGCAVGGGDIYWRNTLVADENCWDQAKCQQAIGSGTFQLYTGPFYKTEESCHMIEYYSVDLLGNGEQEIKKQCVFVDNTGPNPVKEVGDPKDKWTPGENGDSESYFYPEETEHCWDQTGEEIDCWQVTTLTEIQMNCEDPGTHPVGEKKVCFKVDMDGEDVTQRYCSEYNGIYNMNGDGYCCMRIRQRRLLDIGEVDLEDDCEEGDLECFKRKFYFLEETEHNLKYYCIDKLWNVGPIDEEKFKVEGTKFEIPLYKKWNLISVPFTLLNNDPREVFKDVDEYVDSVWTYDPDHAICDYDWCVWSPGDAPGDLTIEPGWGYWVLVTEKPEDELETECIGDLCDLFEEPIWLTIGGSLFSPAKTPPSRNLQKGWNLIGYYGTSWEIYEWSDFNFCCGDAFNFPDRFLYGDKVYCALNSLIDTQEGYPRWSSVWSYINCGDHVDSWLGLNACADQSLQQALDRMYAGRGYWLELDTPDIYAPATTCIWNSDFECRWTGGGIIP
jgi:hypothetical protein